MTVCLVHFRGFPHLPANGSRPTGFAPLCDSRAHAPPETVAAEAWRVTCDVCRKMLKLRKYPVDVERPRGGT